MQSILQRKGIEGISPIAREVKCTAVPTQKNVVLIFMESMSANLMEHFGSTKKLTPFLDSLYLESLSFDHFYSAGIHTNHGMYATLSFPCHHETECHERSSGTCLFGVAHRIKG